tara:strand:- start:812 stop:985 length:174 start_codon:yes stop_codon:yes gene_type:complete
MHPVAISLAILALCALLCRTFRNCARSQRSVFLDHDRDRALTTQRRFSYQALPTTVV